MSTINRIIINLACGMFGFFGLEFGILGIMAGNILGILGIMPLPLIILGCSKFSYWSDFLTKIAGPYDNPHDPD